MQKTIQIGDKSVPVKTDGLVPLTYKREFHRDFFKDVAVLQEGEIDCEILLSMLWLFAKTADNTIANIEEWLSSFDTVPVLDYVVELRELTMACLISEKVENNGDSKKKTTT